mgnify:FL=1
MSDIALGAEDPDRFLEAYRKPMEIYVRRLLGRMRGRTPSADEVSDVVQAFLVECIE